MSACSTPKTMMLAAIPSARMNTAVMAKPGERRIWRRANRRSCSRVFMCSPLAHTPEQFRSQLCGGCNCMKTGKLWPVFANRRVQFHPWVSIGEQRLIPHQYFRLDARLRNAESDLRGVIRAMQNNRTIFFIGLLLAASGVFSPAIALAGGIAFGFTVEHPFRTESGSLAKLLLQASVVALGFGMDLRQVAHAGRSGFIYTAISISSAMLLGLLFGSLLKVAGKASFLISAGTAICGGSAIAAIAPITGADEEEISVSMGTVFLLNSVALLIFPAIGHALHL